MIEVKGNNDDYNMDNDNNNIHILGIDNFGKIIHIFNKDRNNTSECVDIGAYMRIHMTGIKRKKFV